MQYSTRNLAACLLAIYAQETFARPQDIPAQSSSVEVGVSSEASAIPIATSAIGFSVAPDTTIASEVLVSSSSESIATSPASEPAASGLRPLPGLQTEEAGPLAPLPGLASDIPPVAVPTAIAGGAAVVDKTMGVTSEAATPAETSVSLKPLLGLASSAVDEAASLARLVTTTSELIPLFPETSTTAEASVVSLVQSTTEVTSAATSTLELSSLISSSTAVAEATAFPSSVALETTATEASTTETAAADAPSTDATSGFLTSVLAESSTSPSSAAAKTTRAAITSRPSGFFRITNGTAPGASGVAGGKPHGTGTARQSLVTGISSPSGTGGIRFGNSTQTSGFSSAVTTSRGGSGSLTTLTTVSDGITRTLVTAIAAQTSGIARNASNTATTGSDSGAGRPMDMVGGALVAGVAGMLGMLLV
ncbi:hypothetical protein QBC45DRAFT_104519 [Copromyces sp. CBS 386.78]|nr:hypothetical protein QBC45DRAFT_104519 [Copromyces sp. CBS 386.78]